MSFFNFIRREAAGASSLINLIFKAAIFGASFYILPFWFFVVVAAYLYFFPLFGSWRFFFFFAFLLGLAYVSTPYFWTTAVLAVVFFLILGVKELILIDRISVFETIVYVFTFFIFWDFFYRFSFWSQAAVVWSAAAALLIFVLLKITAANLPEKNLGRRKEFLLVALVSFLIWETELVFLFLPLNFFYQTALSLLIAAILIDFLFNYLKNSVSLEKILMNFSVFFVLAAVILASATWGI